MKLFRNLKADEIDCRISQIETNWCTLLLYKDARCDMNILDETVGPYNWKRTHLRDNANCIVSIYNTERQEWVSKEDTGTESFSEAEKGLASDSFKRACVNWGIGRELYTAPGIIVFPRPDMVKKGKDAEFYLNNKGKYETKTRFNVEIITYDENENIKDLIVRDNKKNIRFAKVSKELDKKLLDLNMKFNNLLEQAEAKDKNFDRKKLYEMYGSTSSNNMLYTEIKEAIKLLEEKFEEKK